MDSNSIQNICIPTTEWVNDFMTRHNLVYRTPSFIKKEALMVTKSKITTFFNETLHGLRNFPEMLKNPSSVINMDETLIHFDYNKNFACPVEAEQAFSTVEKSKDFATICYCFNAAGHLLPSQIILKNEFKSNEEVKKRCEEKGFFVSFTKNGYQAKRCFDEYVKFLVQHLALPSIIFIDNDPTHCNLELVGWCKEKNVFLKFLPPETTSKMQPCDVAIFRSIKASYRKAYFEWRKTNKSKLSIFEFLDIIEEVNCQIPTSIVQKGFQKAGIYPFNIDAVIDKFIDDGKIQNFYLLIIKLKLFF